MAVRVVQQQQPAWPTLLCFLGGSCYFLFFCLVSDFISHFRLVWIAEPTITAFVATPKKCGNRLPDCNLNWKKLWIKEMTFYQNNRDVKGRVSLSEIERESECATNPTMDLIRSQEKECLSGNRIEMTTDNLSCVKCQLYCLSSKERRLRTKQNNWFGWLTVSWHKRKLQTAFCLHFNWTVVIL